MILNNKVSQKLEIIGFKESVKKSTSRIQVKVKGSAFLSAICIKKSGIQIQNNSLWHLNNAGSLVWDC